MSEVYTITLLLCQMLDSLWESLPDRQLAGKAPGITILLGSGYSDFINIGE